MFRTFFETDLPFLNSQGMDRVLLVVSEDQLDVPGPQPVWIEITTTLSLPIHPSVHPLGEDGDLCVCVSSSFPSISSQFLSVKAVREPSLVSEHRVCLHPRICVSSSLCSPWLEPEVEISQEGSIYTTEIGERYKSSFPFPSGRRLLNIY